MESEIYLTHYRSGHLAAALLRSPPTVANVRDHEESWRPFFLRALRMWQREGQLTEHWPHTIGWDWRSLLEKSSSSDFDGFAIIRNGMTQGLMKLEHDYPVSLSRQSSRRVLYMAYVETAPWNNPRLVVSPSFSAVGSALVAAAVRRSIDLGYGGVIGLHSHPEAESFYAKKCGLIARGKDPIYDGQQYFEYTEERAHAFLERNQIQATRGSRK
jgi:hypothetical protein